MKKRSSAEALTRNYLMALWPLSALAFFSACSSRAPEAASAPEPVVIPVASVSTIHRAAIGSYALRVEIESGNRPPQARGRRTGQQGSVALTADTARVIQAGGPTKQYHAAITLPGYSRPSRRGQAGQFASWWRAEGDSVVVMFSHGGRGQVQLRGALQGTTLRGDIWYVSEGTGSTYQLGTFTGTKAR